MRLQLYPGKKWRPRPTPLAVDGFLTPRGGNGRSDCRSQARQSRSGSHGSAHQAGQSPERRRHLSPCCSLDLAQEQNVTCAGCWQCSFLRMRFKISVKGRVRGNLTRAKSRLAAKEIKATLAGTLVQRNSRETE